MNPLAYLRVAEFLAGLALIGGICWGAHEFLEHERDIGRNEVRAEYAQKLSEAKDAARQREMEMQNQLNDAVKRGQEREKTIQTLAAASDAASLGLRDTIKSIGSRVPSLSEDALRSLTSAYGVLSAECAARRIEVAKDAEGRNTNVQTLIDAWPTEPVKK